MTNMRAGSREGGAAVNLIVGLAVLFAVLALAWMILLPVVVRRLARTRTGFGVRMQSLYCNPFAARLRMQGVTVTNPSGFPRRDFLDVRDLEVDARPGSLFSRDWEIDDASVHLAGITLVRDARGRVNLWQFAHALRGPAATPPAGSAPAHRFLIRRLTVRVDRVVVADYSHGGRPAVREYTVDFNHTYTNVSDLKGLAAPLAAILKRTGMTANGLVPKAGVLLREAGEHLENAGLQAGQAVKGLIESLEKRLRD